MRDPITRGAMAVLTCLFVLTPTAGIAGSESPGDFAAETVRNAQRMLEEGQQIFRHDTFGDEVFWTDALRMNEAIAGHEHGGLGSGISPKTALSVGLKVDTTVLPPALVSQLRAGQVNLNDAAVTLALLKLQAVVGLRGTFDDAGRLRTIGITCALCHSTVDDAFAPGMGQRLDGWPNRDLNVGAIVGLAPNLSAVTALLGVDEATLKKVLAAWGPGKFDPTVFLDGKAFRPDGKTGAVLLPPAYGLAGVNLATYTGWGSVTYWNALVSNLEMHGKGTFNDARLNDARQFPVAARAHSGATRNADDRITAKLASLHFYQLAIPAPTPPAGTFDRALAARGEAVFAGKAKCASCHVPPLFTDPGWNMHTPDEIAIDDFQANRSPERRYRTTPLRGLFSRQKGGFYHDGRFATLSDVVHHYNDGLALGLSAAEMGQLVEYLKSL